jgi:dihydrofolate reductase
MRRIRYQVASSLDGFIAGPNGETDWIPAEPEIDFDGLFAQFDTLLMGRRTFEELPDGTTAFEGKRIIVFSRTLRQQDHPEVTVVRDATRQWLDELRAKPGKDIWLFGGGELFRTLLDLDCVDTVEPAVVPVLLGGGRPLLPVPAASRALIFRRQRVYQQSGIVLLEYDVAGREGASGAD